MVKKLIINLFDMTYLSYIAMSKASLGKNNNDVYVNMKIIKLDRSIPTNVHPRVYNHIKTLFATKTIMNAIHDVEKVGTNTNDKIICLTNLFFLAVRQDKMDAMQTILDHVDKRYGNQFIDYIVNSYDRLYTPLMHAAYNLSSKSVKCLITCGADIDAKNIDGESVYEAAESGYNDMLEKNDDMVIFYGQKYKDIISFIDVWKKKENEDEDDFSDFVFVNK